MSLKTATFTLHATAEQSARWKQASESEGFKSVGVWAARALDAFLRVRAKAGIPTPLSWHKGRFQVVMLDGREVELPGMVSPPFATYRGTGIGPHRKVITLVYLPAKRIIATLKTARQAHALAAELAPVYARDDAGVAIVERHRSESV